MRVKRGKVSRRKHKKVIKKTKGMLHIRRASVKKAKEAVMKAGQYSYRDRRAKKRTSRSLWIIRLNNAVKEYGLSYSKFIDSIKKNKVGLDRKILSEIAVKNPEIFKKIIDSLK